MDGGRRTRRHLDRLRTATAEPVGQAAQHHVPGAPPLRDGLLQPNRETAAKNATAHHGLFERLEPGELAPHRWWAIDLTRPADGDQRCGDFSASAMDAIKR